MIRQAFADAAMDVARLLDAFNREFETPTPGPDVLAARLRHLLAAESTAAFLAGAPAVGLALVTYRPNVWSDGPVALLEELYVHPDHRDQGLGTNLIGALVEHARGRGAAHIEVNVDESDGDALRFYIRHRFRLMQPDTGERAFYLSRELA